MLNSKIYMYMLQFSYTICWICHSIHLTARRVDEIKTDYDHI